jgi:hypothetical protein
MIRLIWVAALATLPALPAVAAPGCTISPLNGMQKPGGATVSMQAQAARPCGTKLWVQPGVIPYSDLRATRQPLHGHLTLSEPTQFTYTANGGYQGTDRFEIIGRGNNSGGGQVTGTLTVNVTVAGGR